MTMTAAADKSDNCRSIASHFLPFLSTLAVGHPVNRPNFYFFLSFRRYDVAMETSCCVRSRCSHSFPPADTAKRDRWQSDVGINLFKYVPREDNIATFRPPMRIVAL